ncbi:ribbon-helix-helix protein, CopG family [Aureibacillus halotolerans]|uniref:Ribbon-helix-helix CopG family protein n=1 Tax=Aureibacillus halotolerans TaxID=1508390 RepID=A0A4R6TU12_9BACI|nr:ribbon-helix-helix protein, CopG family [Aureibacillus halotolerans]TDQ37198.1 ribbon-helix-helix CopG family protein [Aureibacillus halotolerans]
MSKKRISATVSEDFDSKLNERAQKLGVSKSALVSFALGVYMSQLDILEKNGTSEKDLYDMIRFNYEEMSR